MRDAGQRPPRLKDVPMQLEKGAQKTKNLFNHSLGGSPCWEAEALSFHDVDFWSRSYVTVGASPSSHVFVLGPHA